jgi:hypothetical protein
MQTPTGIHPDGFVLSWQIKQTPDVQEEAAKEAKTRVTAGCG